ncbi:MAG: site-2 protease family protein [Gemmatimonadota bacterium]|nr:site-2 protease family protein [Gemmatimonadota bacterium]
MSGSPDLVLGLVYYVVFLISTTFHEAAHAWAALRGGDPTAYHGGQVSLDPIPHIRREPVGMVVLPIISVLISGWPFGFASAPYSVKWARAYPRRAAWMALAGPAANVVLVLAAVAAIRIGVATGVFAAPSEVTFGSVVIATSTGLWASIATLLSVLFSLNILLAVFNLFPFPPLDGSAVIPLFLDAERTRRYQDVIWGNPALGWVGIIIAWQLFGYVFDPVWLGTVNLLHAGVTYG